MTLLEWGAIGELIGGVAIIVSLIYVGLQIKQNSYALKLSTAQNTVEDMADLYLYPAQNGELADIFFRGLQDLDAVEGSDRLRLYGFFHKFFRTYENRKPIVATASVPADTMPVVMTSQPASLGAQRPPKASDT